MHKLKLFIENLHKLNLFTILAIEIREQLWHERENTRLVAQAAVGAFGRLQQVTRSQVLVAADMQHSISGTSWRVGANPQCGSKK